MLKVHVYYHHEHFLQQNKIITITAYFCCNYTFKNFVVEMALDGKTALVTGFAGAIGSTIAKTLANAGCDVIGIDRVKQKIAQKSIDEIKAG